MKPGKRSKVAGPLVPDPRVLYHCSGPELCAIVAVAICLAPVPAKPVQAATNSASFGVGATVVAPCVVTPQFLARFKGAIGTSGLAPCTTGSKPAANIPTIRPRTTLGRDSATGLETLTVEF